jgi:hypothetical protein
VSRCEKKIHQKNRPQKNPKKAAKRGTIQVTRLNCESATLKADFTHLSNLFFHMSSHQFLGLRKNHHKIIAEIYEYFRKIFFGELLRAHEIK